MNVQDVPLDALRPYERNARFNRYAVAPVADSIKAFGFKVPIVAEPDGTIIAGHTRYRAARQLGLETVPVIYADDLTEEQARAFRLADNKVSEVATWKDDLLAFELQELSAAGVDMGLFGFDLPQLNDGELLLDPLDEEEEHRHHEAVYAGERTYNLDLAFELEEWDEQEYPMCGSDVPPPDDLLAFSALGEYKWREYRSGVHCFIDDYRIERLWRDPRKYVSKLARHECVCTPDYSLYLDMPDPMTRWNVYRQRMLGAWWETQGVKTVPTVTWGDANTWAYAWAGVRKGSTIALSTISMTQKQEYRELWQEGYDLMVDAIEPAHILAYDINGEQPDWHGADVHFYENDRTAAWRQKQDN